MFLFHILHCPINCRCLCALYSFSFLLFLFFFFYIYIIFFCLLQNKIPILESTVRRRCKCSLYGKFIAIVYFCLKLLFFSSFFFLSFLLFCCLLFSVLIHMMCRCGDEDKPWKMVFRRMFFFFFLLFIHSMNSSCFFSFFLLFTSSTFFFLTNETMPATVTLHQNRRIWWTRIYNFLVCAISVYRSSDSSWQFRFFFFFFITVLCCVASVNRSKEMMQTFDSI